METFHVPLWYLIYIIPLGLSIGWLGLNMVFGLGHGGGHDIHHDVGGGGHDLHHDAGHDIHHDAGEHSLGHEAISVIGLGQVPVVLWFQILFLIWGLSGLLLSGLGELWSVLLALPLTLVLTAVLSRLLYRIMPGRIETSLPSTEERRGMSGVVVTSKLDEQFGEIRLDTKQGPVYMNAYSPTPLSRDTRVVVMEIRADGTAVVTTEEELGLLSPRIPPNEEDAAVFHNSAFDTELLVGVGSKGTKEK